MNLKLHSLDFIGKPFPEKLRELLDCEIRVSDSEPNGNAYITVTFRSAENKDFSATLIDIDQRSLPSSVELQQDKYYYLSSHPDLVTHLYQIIQLSQKDLSQKEFITRQIETAKVMESSYQEKMNLLNTQSDQLNKAILEFQEEQLQSNQYLTLISHIERFESLEDLILNIPKWSTHLLNEAVELIYQPENKDEYIHRYFEDNIYTESESVIAPILSNDEIFLAIKVNSGSINEKFYNHLLNLQSIFKQKAKSILAQIKLDEEQAIWNTALDQISIPILIVKSNENIVFKNKAFSNLQVPFTNLLNQEKNDFVVKDPKATYNVELIQTQSDCQIFKIFFLHNKREEKDLLINTIVFDKFNLINRLSNKIAHELSNPIGGIKNLIDVLIATYQLKQPIVEDLSQIREGAERALKIIKALQSFSNQESKITEVCNPNDLINESFIFSKSLTRSMKIQFTSLNKEVKVKVQPDLFKQIIFNLIQNAYHACQHKGIVHIELSNQENKVQIKVTDNGPGVPPSLQSQIFEPTFSTKSMGEGTGLGLAFVKKTLDAWGGTIFYDSTYLEGARFIIELPIAIS